jgi:hypothetical protein
MAPSAPLFSILHVKVLGIELRQSSRSDSKAGGDQVSASIVISFPETEVVGLALLLG